MELTGEIKNIVSLGDPTFDLFIGTYIEAFAPQRLVILDAEQPDDAKFFCVQRPLELYDDFLHRAVGEFIAF